MPAGTAGAAVAATAGTAGAAAVPLLAAHTAGPATDVSFSDALRRS